MPDSYFFVIFFCESMSFGVQCLAVLLVIKLVFKLRTRQIDEQVLAIAANNLILIAGCTALVYYPVDLFIAWYSGPKYEHYAIITRIRGKYWFAYYLPFIFYGLLPQLIWFKRIRYNPRIFVYWAIIKFASNLFILVGYHLDNYINLSPLSNFDFIDPLKYLLMFTVALTITYSILIYRKPEIKLKTSF